MSTSYEVELDKAKIEAINTKSKRQPAGRPPSTVPGGFGSVGAPEGGGRRRGG